ncbi:MAG: DUF4359 domain-containing protein [Prevotella sp.]|nr:DUF4359 domain-containing protein [Prevotella sp.]
METTTKTKKISNISACLLLSFTILLAIAVAALALNPSEEDHHTAISNNVTQAVNELFSEQTEKIVGKGYPSIQKLADKASKPLITETVNDLVHSQIEYHNHILFSTTTYTIPEGIAPLLGDSKNSEEEGEGSEESRIKTISVGVFGKVFTADKCAIKRVIRAKVVEVINESGFIGNLMGNDSSIISNFYDMLTEDKTKDKIAAGMKIVDKVIGLVMDE